MVVKVADPFAKPGMPLCYSHSKTNLYNDIFFNCWDNFFVPTFDIVCTWFSVDSMESLNRLFDLEFEGWVYTLPSFKKHLGVI